jgi:Ca-activated chloride channel family protein
MPRFDQPWFLLLGLLALPVIVLGWRALSATDPLRRAVILALRSILIIGLAVVLSGPHVVRQHDHLTVIGVLDISGSVQRFANLPAIEELKARSNIEYLRRWFRQATQMRESDDRFGLIVFDGRAIAVSAPTRADYVDDNLDVSMLDGTNIAQAVRLALAMFPADTAKRIVLVTDGNETAGNLMDALKATTGDSRLTIDDLRLADGAAPRSSIVNRQSSIPVDVLPIAYRVRGDVQVVRIEAVPIARPEQTITARIILEATEPIEGLLTLRREGVPVDINGREPGTSRHVSVPAGQSVHLVQVTLGQTPVNRFEAVFEADDPAADVLPDNNRAEAFTATPSRGSVLVLDRDAAQRSNAMQLLLDEAKIPVAAQTPAEFATDLLSLQNHDLIVLDNVAASELSTQQQQLIATYVNDLGGGLIMIGGPNSFGAGGWHGTPVADLLPVLLDPPREMRLVSGAVVFVMDKSGSMNHPVAGARTSQQQIANEGAALAIESLMPDTLVGVISFDMSAHTVVDLQPNDDTKRITERVRSIQAEGGTNLEPGLRRAYEWLRDKEVAKKRVVCLTDGRSHNTDLQPIAQLMAGANIQLTTIAVGDDADHDLLAELAKIGGGEFYPVRDPRTLPGILIDSVQILNKPLIKEVAFVPKVLATGSTLAAGMDLAPALGGLVITAPRDDPHAIIEMISPDNEPLLAHWQSGLGRVAAFTSDLGQNWSSKWLDWPGATAFWVQLVRTIARPPSNPDAELIVTLQDDRLMLALDLSANGAPGPGGAGGSTDYVQVEGSVYRPDGTATPVRLRQTAPGHYQGAVEAPAAGNYIVALNPRQGQRRLSPVIGGASKATSPEFRNYTSNLALLEDVVELTSGRRLSLDEPLAFNLYDRTGMPPSVSSLPAWRTILWWTIALVLLDVAARRIAWNSQTIRALVVRAIERVTPGHVRGAEAAATLATLRRVSEQVEDRREAESAGLERLKGTGRIAPPPERAVTPAYPEADSSRITSALDALLGRSQPPPLKPSQSDAGTPPAPPGSTETTSSLLAAKRRARQQMKDGG